MARKFYKEENELIPAIKFALTTPVGFTEITDVEEIKKLYLNKYINRIEGGKKYVLDFIVNIYIEILNGVYTDTEVFELESYLGELCGQLNNGCWLTAKNTNTNLSLSGIYTQTIKDEIQLEIDNYIDNEY